MSNGNSFRRDQRQQQRTQTRFANMRLQDYRRATQLDRMAAEAERRRRAAEAEAERRRQEAQQRAEAEARRLREQVLQQQRHEQAERAARQQAEALAQQQEALRLQAQRLAEQLLQSRQAAADIGALLSKGSSEALSKELKEKYGETLGGEMSRQMRVTPTTSEQTLKQRAEKKISERESHNSSEGRFTGSSSGGFNVKGKPVSGLTKGTGQGFRAGDPARWHVHYDHVKWGTSAATRINFQFLPKQTILAAFQSQPPQPGTLDRPSWDACLRWMRANL